MLIVILKIILFWTIRIFFIVHKEDVFLLFDTTLLFWKSICKNKTFPCCSLSFLWSWITCFDTFPPEECYLANCYALNVTDCNLCRICERKGEICVAWTRKRTFLRWKKKLFLKTYIGVNKLWANARSKMLEIFTLTTAFPLDKIVNILSNRFKEFCLT